MIVTVLSCLAGAAMGTAAMLETSVRRSQRRGALQRRSQELKRELGTERHTWDAGLRPAHVDVPEALARSGNAELYDLAAFRAVRRPTQHADGEAVSEQVAETQLAAVVPIDFRAQDHQQRLRARA